MSSHGFLHVLIGRKKIIIWICKWKRGGYKRVFYSPWLLGVVHVKNQSAHLSSHGTAPTWKPLLEYIMNIGSIGRETYIVYLGFYCCSISKMEYLREARFHNSNHLWQVPNTATFKTKTLSSLWILTCTKVNINDLFILQKINHLFILQQINSKPIPSKSNHFLNQYGFEGQTKIMV